MRPGTEKFIVIKACVLPDVSGRTRSLVPGQIIHGAHWNRFVKSGYLVKDIPAVDAVAPTVIHINAQPAADTKGEIIVNTLNLKTDDPTITGRLGDSPNNPMQAIRVEAKSAPIEPKDSLPTATDIDRLDTADLEPIAKELGLKIDGLKIDALRSVIKAEMLAE